MGLYIEYFNVYTFVDVMTKGKFSSIFVANIDIIHWSIHSFSTIGGDGVKVVDERIVNLVSYKFHLLEHMKIWCNLQVIINPLMFIHL